MNEIVKNIKKVNDEMYEYDSVRTFIQQISVEGLNDEKANLEKRLVNINYLLSEIAKL